MAENRGAYIEYYLRKNNISIAELSKKLGVHRQSVYGWLNDASLSADIISAIGNAIGHNFKFEFPELAYTNYKPIIYLIDDAELDLEIVERCIKHVVLAKKIEAFKNGQEALDKLKDIWLSNVTELPDIIFLDLNMPVLDGWEFLFEFEKLKLYTLKDITIYILSSSASRADRQKSISSPLVKEFISKPIQLDKMKSILQKTDA